MNITKAFQRIFWRFGKGQFTPNQQDVDSLNFIAEYVNETQKQTLRSHQLFAKMYTRLFEYELLRVGDMNAAKKNMELFCGLSLAQHIDHFAFAFNGHHYALYCKKRHIPISDELYDTGEAKELVKWAIQNDEEYRKELGGYYPVGKIEKALIKDLDELIHKYKNHD